jgi:hypothetical protein
MTTLEVNGRTCETGCVLDSHWGWHNHARLIQLAIDLDVMTLTPEELAMVESYDDGTWLDDYYEAVGLVALLDEQGVQHFFRADYPATAEIIMEMMDEAENALNEHTPKGFFWFWYEGDFLLNAICDEDEDCDDDTCAHWAWS